MARGSKASELLQVASWAPQQGAIYHVLIQLSQDNVFVISPRLQKSASDTSCSPEMHGCLCHTSSCLCPVQKTNCTNGINFGISPFQTGLSLIFCGISYILIGLSLR